MEPTSKTITFVLTEACNFACGYCYLVHKKQDRRMPMEVARAAVDYLLANEQLFWEDRAYWEFIGGEPLLEVGNIERIIDYIKRRTFELEHRWFHQSWFHITTNGSLYHIPAVQRLIEQYRSHLEISITIDGPAHMHNRERIFPDGTGTYGAVIANIPLWLRQFPNSSTKVTISHNNLPDLTEAILHIFSLGIKTVNSNCVFEPVWQEGDDAILEAQLDRLADAMIAGGLFPEHSCSFFNRHVGRPLDPVHENQNWCGPGRMLAIDCEGFFYPCNHFLDFALGKREGRSIGNIHDGLDMNRLRPFLALSRTAQSTAECISCEVASGCAWCQGVNYDTADTPTIYQRSVALCQMHKARARANQRFWSRVDALGLDPGARAR